MEEERLPFLWELFVDEKVGAVEQIIHFTEQVIFIENLTGFLDSEDALSIYIMDVELRVPKDEIWKGRYDPITIEI